MAMHFPPLKMAGIHIGGESASGLNQTGMPETDKAFLERNNVKGIINDLLESLCHHQPDDPLDYICNYFENISLQGDPVKLAYDRLKSINHNCSVFDDCLLEVYEMFVQTAAAASTKRIPKISLADLFNKLLDLLTGDLLSQIKIEFYNRLKKKEHEVFSFTWFKSSLTLVYLCKEFLAECVSLFAELQRYSNGIMVNRALCEILIEQLKKSVKFNSSPDNLQGAFQCMFDLSSHGLNTILNEKYDKACVSKETISLNEFQIAAFRCFMESI